MDIYLEWSSQCKEKKKRKKETQIIVVQRSAFAWQRFNVCSFLSCK